MARATDPAKQRGADLCFIDCETTGVLFGVHEIIDVAVIRTSPDATNEKNWHRRIRPEHPEWMSPKAQQMNGFNEAEWSNEPRSSTTLWTEFADFVRDCVPVAHNPSFDRAFITLAAAAVHVRDLGTFYHWIGTETLAWPWFKANAFGEMSLPALCAFCNVTPELDPHTALGGAKVCLQVYRALMEKTRLFTTPGSGSPTPSAPSQEPPAGTSAR